MICKRCHLDKPDEAFDKSGHGSQRRNYCKVCRAASVSAPLPPRLKALQDSIMAGRAGYKPISLTEFTRICELPYGESK